MFTGLIHLFTRNGRGRHLQRLAESRDELPSSRGSHSQVSSLDSVGEHGSAVPRMVAKSLEGGMEHAVIRAESAYPVEVNVGRCGASERGYSPGLTGQLFS